MVDHRARDVARHPPAVQRIPRPGWDPLWSALRTPFRFVGTI